VLNFCRTVYIHMYSSSKNNLKCKLRICLLEVNYISDII